MNRFKQKREKRKQLELIGITERRKKSGKKKHKAKKWKKRNEARKGDGGEKNAIIISFAT